MNLHTYCTCISVLCFYSDYKDNEGNYHLNITLSISDRTGDLDQEATLAACHVENGGKTSILMLFTLICWLYFSSFN